MRLQHKTFELSRHPSDNASSKKRNDELSFSPHAKRKGGWGDNLDDFSSPSKRLKFRNNLNFWEQKGRRDLAGPISETPEMLGEGDNRFGGKSE